MADKTEIKDLTPEELEEIERIVSALPGGSGATAQQQGDLLSLNNPPRDMNSLGGAGQDFGLEEPGYGEIEEIIPEEEIEDITGMVHELDEPVETFEPEESIEEALPELEPFEVEPEEEELPSIDIEEIEPVEETAETEAAEPAITPFEYAEEPQGGRSARSELDALTRGEPASVDAQEVPEDIYNENDFEFEPEVQAAEEYPAFEELNAAPAEEAADEEFEPIEASAPSVSIDGGIDDELPDLSALSIGETRDIPEALDTDIPDIGIDSLGSFSEPESIDEVPAQTAAKSDIDDIDAFDVEVPMDAGQVPDILADELPDIPSIRAIEDVVANEEMPDIPDSPPVSEPVYDAFETSPEPESYDQPKSGKSGMDLSDSEIRRLKTAIMLFAPALIRAIKDVILNDRCSESDTRTLVDMIISGRSENDIKRFLEDRLHTRINIEAGASKRKVISSRSEYATSSGRERQKKLFRTTRIAALGLLVIGALTVLGYQYVYKPWKAKSLISEGVAFILKKAEKGDELKNFEKAESIFKRVNDEYQENYLPGYNRYGRAYFDKKQYARSLNKLNAAYKIKPSDIDTLNNLGFYYKKVSKTFYEDELKDRLKEMYYTKSTPAVERIQSQYDVAIDFYLKAKHLSPKNITALVGIGDVYFVKGDYLKARLYYESILKVDPDSEAGYAGLLNLFIERDDFPDLLTVYVELREKDLLEKIPSPLLGKLAEYLLSKTAHGDKNIRIEYGIQSERIKDASDNPFPAVRSVLSAMHKRDSDYPPLYLHYAKFAMAQKNYPMVKGYLEQAVEHADKTGQKYFGALSMLGEYYYRMKDPTKSYKYLKEALSAVNYPPDFTQEEFYTETESSGRTKAVMGNIFYYFFDKVTSRFGDDKSEANLEEDTPSAETDKMLNYDIAMKKYESAIADGYSSSELHYNLGRIYYLKGLHENALNQWLSNYEDFVSSPEIMYALGNAFYHMNNSDAAKAEFQKLISVNEFEAEKIRAVVPSREDHFKIFDSLAAAYNNLGAVYLRKGSETRSNICFFKAIEYSNRLGLQNEFARVNLARTIRKKGDTRQPVLDENIPFSVDIYRADSRDRHEYK